MALFGKSLFARKAAEDDTENVEPAFEDEYTPSESLKRVMRSRYLPGAEELNKQKDVAELAIGCFAKAKDAIETIRPLIKEARCLADAALKLKSAEKKQALAERYSAIKEKIDSIARDASYKSVNLVDGSGVQLCLDTNSHYKAGINIANINLTTDRKGLALPPARFSFQEDVEARDIITFATQAEQYLDWASDLLCKEAQLIAIRLAETISLARPTSYTDSSA